MASVQSLLGATPHDFLPHQGWAPVSTGGEAAAACREGRALGPPGGGGEDLADPRESRRGDAGSPQSILLPRSALLISRPRSPLLSLFSRALLAGLPSSLLGFAPLHAALPRVPLFLASNLDRAVVSGALPRKSWCLPDDPKG